MRWLRKSSNGVTKRKKENRKISSGVQKKNKAKEVS